MKKFENPAEGEWETFLIWARTPPLPPLHEVNKRRLALIADGWAQEHDPLYLSPVGYGNGPDGSGRAYTSNHTGYSQPGSHNWEHDDTGNVSNFSGVVDEFINARIEGEGLEPGYDYD